MQGHDLTALVLFGANRSSMSPARERVVPEVEHVRGASRFGAAPRELLEARERVQQSRPGEGRRRRKPACKELQRRDREDVRCRSTRTTAGDTWYSVRLVAGAGELAPHYYNKAL